MDSELMAIGLVLLAVAAVLMVAVGWAPTPLDVHMVAVHVDGQAQLLASQLAERLPR